jgi:hypothetical protein
MQNSKPPRKAQQQPKSNLQLDILEWWDASGETYMPYLLQGHTCSFFLSCAATFFHKTA